MNFHSEKTKKTKQRNLKIKFCVDYKYKKVSKTKGLIV